MTFLTQVASAFLALTITLSAQAVEPAVTFDRIEEDWVVFVANPDDKIGAPQIINVIAPSATGGGHFGMVELNHGSQPQFENGGFPVQSLVNDTNYEHRWSQTSALLRHDFDKLQYTISMEAAGDRIRYGLKNGRSKSWGKFAKDGLFAEAPAPQASVVAYNPDHSVSNTTVNVGAHRVALMYQREVRYYLGDQLVKKDATPRILHRFRKVVEFVSLEEYEQKEEYFNIDITE